MALQHGMPMYLSPSFGHFGFHLQPPPSGLSPNQQAKPSSSAKRPVGRPPGSRNKPKPSMVISQDNYDMMPAIIEVGAGKDVMEVVAQLARLRNSSIMVVHAAGTISNVTLRNPKAEAPYSFIAHGPFVLLGLSGSYLIQSSGGVGFPSSQPSFIPNLSSSVIHPTFTISISSLQGEEFSGIVAGKVMAGNNGVTITAMFVQNLEYHSFSVVTEGDIMEEDIDNPRGSGVSGAHEGASGFEGGACASGFGMPGFIQN
ncbi:AT-hook motif nuclear-localized protein 28-like [Lotus japonicus]|uniref:AT-hook motif nuclear-localized protein 28-like n=1 Tax=Lotus japonicus TaxID=34305 RepID=UPI00258EA9EC|nr:AT-hook motif nuclear-localized protein 28-like [Lotus japonicus]